MAEDQCLRDVAVSEDVCQLGTLYILLFIVCFLNLAKYFMCTLYLLLIDHSCWMYRLMSSFRTHPVLLCMFVHYQFSALINFDQIYYVFYISLLSFLFSAFTLYFLYQLNHKFFFYDYFIRSECAVFRLWARLLRLTICWLMAIDIACYCYQWSFIEFSCPLGKVWSFSL